MNWVTICDEQALPAKRGVAAWVAGKAVAIFHLGDAGIYAIDNIDPATGVSVLSRGLLCEFDNELFVASPLHKQHYSLTTGHCLENEVLSVDVYEVKRESGKVLARLLA
ncbi:nitrite reductase small subunit NirD [Shewanella sp. 10N.286.45.A1]|uniref:nitrite reductase small subunit NirD n=1 Tax=Shewanella sp. 10N.286.45.A1 TaxID=3229694 RepID=UPI0035531DE9